MWELDYKESWVLKNWCFWTVMLKKTLESLLDCKEIKPVHSKGNSPEHSLEGLVLNLKLPILWPPDAKTWLIGKNPDAGKDWRQEEKGMIENEMVGWHHWLDGHEFEQAPGVGDGQGGLVCCSPWDCKKVDTTERLNWWWQYIGITSFHFKNDRCNCYETHLDQSENNSLKIKEWENFNRKSANKKESEAERVRTKRNLPSSLLRKYVLFHIKTCIHKRCWVDEAIQATNIYKAKIKENLIQHSYKFTFLYSQN